MTPQTLTSKTVVTTEKVIEYLVVHGDVIVYRITTTTRSGRRKPTVTVSEGITSKASLVVFQKGAVTMPSYSKEWGAILATPEFLTLVREQGWGSSEFYRACEALTKTPYTRFVEGSAKAEDIVFVEGSSHRLFDVNEQPIPVAMQFSYINGRFDNATYHLDKALKILRKRDDIRFEAEDRWQKPGEINRIPSYNAVRGRSECIQFVWMPKAEDYRRMVARCNEIGGQHPSTNRYHAVFDLDIFGLRAGGAAKFSEFYGHEEPDDDTSDDDFED
jgi:hypothetical protein